MTMRWSGLGLLFLKVRGDMHGPGRLFRALAEAIKGGRERKRKKFLVLFSFLH
jgi:hypothetical protein